MSTFAGGSWGAFVAKYGEPVSTVASPPERTVQDNLDTPLKDGGVPFWARLWAWSIPGTAGAAKTAVTTEQKAREVVDATKAGLSGAVKAASGLGTRVIIILVLVLVGMMMINQIIARRVAA